MLVSLHISIDSKRIIWVNLFMYISKFCITYTCFQLLDNTTELQYCWNCLFMLHIPWPWRISSLILFKYRWIIHLVINDIQLMGYLLGDAININKNCKHLFCLLNIHFSKGMNICTLTWNYLVKYPVFHFEKTVCKRIFWTWHLLVSMLRIIAL